jgi:hypothetical protein
MIRFLTPMIAPSLAGERPGGGPDSVTLVRDGRPVSTIVTADDPAPSARRAAADLGMGSQVS